MSGFGSSILTITLILTVGISVFAVPPVFTTLQPGQFREIEQNLQINIVFVGFEPGNGPRDINEIAFRAGLPATYKSVYRALGFYGLNSSAGPKFNYSYNLVYANSSFEDAFFGYLSSISANAPLGLHQQLYNSQTHRSLDIGANVTIDATAVEKWLAENAQNMTGVNTAQYTVFYINWYGRSDFRFHYYQNASEPDPDTGHTFGLDPEYAARGSGGTTPDDAESPLGGLHRIWFFDLSAGPIELDWNVDDADFIGWGTPQYRMPPVWEYGNLAGYRPFDDLSKDLGLITRFVAINELFTSSPQYKVALSPPRIPNDIQLDMTLYQADPQIDGRTMVNESLILQKVSPLRPTNNFTVELNDTSLSGPAEDAYLCFTGLGPCRPNRFRHPWANLYLYFLNHQNQFLEGDADYEVPIFLYASADSIYGPNGCSCSFADDNWIDGTQSFIYVQMQAFWRHRGFGLTRLTIHEIGHHLGMSHPHDGYDSELNEDYTGFSRFYAYYGADSSTVMKNANLETDFSQFDRDNMNRNMTAAYINQANVILARIIASPRAGEVAPDLTLADQLAANSISRYQSMEYTDSVMTAKEAYLGVLAAAERINIQIEPQAAPADVQGQGKNWRFVDSLDPWRRVGSDH